MSRKLPETEGKRHPISFRTTIDVKDRLSAVASANGRSIAQEMEARLEASFCSDDMRQIIREEIRAALAPILSTVEDHDPGLAAEFDALCGPSAYHRINGQ